MQSVTGRDGYIIAKALIWALEYAKTLPDHDREWGDEEDMRAILDASLSTAKDMIEKERAIAVELSKLQARGATNDEITAHLNAWDPSATVATEDAALARTAANLTSGRISGAIDPK
ncbi:MAG: hypothetical protein PGN25_07375 [Methylorubrum populi]